jgi:hydrogenase maturation factor
MIIISIIWIISYAVYEVKYLNYNNVIIVNNSGIEIAQYVACDCIYEKYKKGYLIMIHQGDSILKIYNPDTVTCINYKNNL